MRAIAFAILFAGFAVLVAAPDVGKASHEAQIIQGVFLAAALIAAIICAILGV